MEMMNAEMFWMKRIFVVLVILQITKHSSAQNTTVYTTTSQSPNPGLGYLTLPEDVTAALGEPAEFKCGAPKTSSGLTFTFYGSNHNYTLSCPSGHVEDIPQALEGDCEEEDGELLAVWTLKGTSFPDNGTRVVCQQRDHTAHTARLYVYDNGSGNSLLIGLGVGACLGVLLVFGLLYLMLMRSERLRKCFRGSDNQEGDLAEIVDQIAPTATYDKMRDL